MSVVIRLRRAGSRKRPFYHVVVADSRMRRDGRFIEILGYYNPMSRPEVVELKADRYADWIQKGAQPSETVDRLVARKQKGGITVSQKDRKRSAKGQKKAEQPQAAKAAPAAQAAPAAPAAEAAEAAPSASE